MRSIRATSRGKSQNVQIPISCSPAPKAKRVSVTEGARETIRLGSVTVPCSLQPGRLIRRATRVTVRVCFRPRCISQSNLYGNRSVRNPRWFASSPLRTCLLLGKVEETKTSQEMDIGVDVFQISSGQDRQGFN